MKIRTFLIVSLAANLGLVAAVVGLVRRPKQLAYSSNNSSPLLLSYEPRAPAQTIGGVPLDGAVARRFRWNELESPDFKTYIANLRSVGCPDETILDLIIAEVEKQFSKRRSALRSTLK